MKSTALLRRLAALAALALPAAVSHAQATEWPNRPVKIVVVFTAGGTTDILARMIGQRLTDRFKQTFVVENKAGGAGNIGTELVVRAPPDGYTFTANSVGPIAVNPSLFKKLPYNPITDLAPVAQIADVPNVLVVHPSTGVKSLADFVRFAKAGGGASMNYASTGIGTASHLSAFLFASRAGFDATHVPYKGADALTDVLAGRVQFMFATIPSVIQHIRAGKLTAIAVSSRNRSRAMPEVPTIAESGYAGFEASSWFGFFAPKDTPREIVLAFNKAVNEALLDKEIDARLTLDGADPAPGTPEKFGEFVKAEFEKWKAVVQQSGATAN